MDLRRFRALVQAMRADGVAKYTTEEGAVIELAPTPAPVTKEAIASTPRKHLDVRDIKSVDDYLKARIGPGGN